MAKGMSFDITEDNTDKIINELTSKKQTVLEMIGLKAEKYAKALCPVGTPESTGKKGYVGGTLRNSITHGVENGDTAYIGSNVEYAPHVELGTGPQFQSPPEWEQFTAQRGSGAGKGIKPRHFLRDAIQDHKSEYEDIIKNELS